MTKNKDSKGKTIMLSARVPEETVKQINTLKDASKTSQAWVISFAVQRLYDEWIESGLTDLASEILGTLETVPGATYKMELDKNGRIKRLEFLKENKEK